MSHRFHRSRQQRAERAPFTGHGDINLVPLVDILTSIVFFSLLTYSGATLAALTAFDLVLPPVIITAEQANQKIPDSQMLNLVLTLRVDNDKMVVDHSGGGGFRQQISGLDATALDQLQGLMDQIRRQYPDNSDVTVIPSDDVQYDNVIHVLDRLRIARFRNISLGTRSRAGGAPPAPMPAASAAAATPATGGR